jgi:hypothetical protein
VRSLPASALSRWFRERVGNLKGRPPLSLIPAAICALMRAQRRRAVSFLPAKGSGVGGVCRLVGLGSTECPGWVGVGRGSGGKGGKVVGRGSGFGTAWGCKGPTSCSAGAANRPKEPASSCATLVISSAISRIALALSRNRLALLIQAASSAYAYEKPTQQCRSSSRRTTIAAPPGTYCLQG